MKTIELKKTKETVIIGGKEVEMDLNTLEVLESVVNSPLKEGFTVAEMASRIRLLDLLKSNKDTKVLELEDSDFSIISGLIKTMKWAIISRFVVELAKQFE